MRIHVQQYCSQYGSLSQAEILVKLFFLQWIYQRVWRDLLLLWFATTLIERYSALSWGKPGTCQAGSLFSKATKECLWSISFYPWPMVVSLCLGNKWKFQFQKVICPNFKTILSKYNFFPMVAINGNFKMYLPKFQDVFLLISKHIYIFFLAVLVSVTNGCVPLSRQ